MIIAALFRCLYIPRHAGAFLVQGRPSRVEDLDLPRRDRGEFSVVKVYHVLGVRDEGGDVGSEVVFLGSDAEDEGASVSKRVDRSRFIRADDTQGVGASELGSGLHDRRSGVSRVAVLQKVNDHFGVRFAVKPVTPPDQ